MKCDFPGCEGYRVCTVETDLTKDMDLDVGFCEPHLDAMRKTGTYFTIKSPARKMIPENTKLGIDLIFKKLESLEDLQFRVNVSIKEIREDLAVMFPRDWRASDGLSKRMVRQEKRTKAHEENSRKL